MATLDQLSRGRMVLGVGSGDPHDPGFARVGEATSGTRAQMLDEGLELITSLWGGEEVTYHGRHYRVEGLQLAVRPWQGRRIPVWVGGDWLLTGVRRRMARFGDGCCVYKGSPDLPLQDVTPDDAREIRSWIAASRPDADRFTIVFGGIERDPDSARLGERLAALERARVDWWVEWVPPGDPARTREAVERGPLRAG